MSVAGILTGDEKCPRAKECADNAYSRPGKAFPACTTEEVLCGRSAGKDERNDGDAKQSDQTGEDLKSSIGSRFKRACIIGDADDGSVGHLGGQGKIVVLRVDIRCSGYVASVAAQDDM